jgi:glycine cleavage system H protein
MGMDFAKLHFSSDHEWIKPADDTDGEVVIGITEYAAGELGDIVFVELPDVGAEFKAGDTLGTIEAVKTVADLYAPVSGTVSGVNSQLEDQPEVVNSSPYEDGWFLKIKMSDPSELESLMSHDAYQEMVGEA